LEEYLEMLDLKVVDLEVVDWEGGVKPAETLFIG